MYQVQSTMLIRKYQNTLFFGASYYNEKDRFLKTECFIRGINNVYENMDRRY